MPAARGDRDNIISMDHPGAIMNLHFLNRNMRLLAVIGFAWLAAPALAQTAVSDLSQGQVGVINFSSVNTTSYADLAGRTGSFNSSAVVKGTLSLPANVSGKVPAVIIAHTCGGVSQAEFNYAKFFNSQGVAAFVLDSFTPRGMTQICTSSSSFNTSAAVADALFALKLLATHPNIDANKIGIFGRSYGGWSVYGSAMEEIRRGVIDSSLKFAAHVAMYPSGCNIRVWSANVTRSPMLILLGAADDWTPAAACMDYNIQLRALGLPVRTIVYANAQHAFDNSSLSTPSYDANRGNQSNCRGSNRVDTGVFSRYDTGEVLSSADWNTYKTNCVSKGATMAYNSDAAASSIADAGIFLAKAVGVTVGNLPANQPDRVFDWIEASFPAYVSPAGSASQSAGGYYFRSYGKSNSYLAAKDGALYYLSPATGTSAISLGDLGSLLNSANQAGY